MKLMNTSVVFSYIILSHFQEKDLCFFHNLTGLHLEYFSCVGKKRGFA